MFIEKNAFTGLERKQIMFNGQFRFQKWNTTVNAMHTLIFKRVEDLDADGRHTPALFLDRAEALHMVSHELLLEKLILICTRGLTLDSFWSYLVGQDQMVDILHIDDSGVKRR